MQYQKKLIEAVLLRRYKRFLADVKLPDGQTITVHTPNTGSMLGCCTPGSRIWIQDSGNPERKYSFTWELIETRPGVITGINTLLANKLVLEAIQSGMIETLQPYKNIRAEVPYGKENSRIDYLVEMKNGQPCYIEVKNVTLVEDGIACFPDAVSRRGSKHLRELAHIVEGGDRGIIIFCIQRNDVSGFRPAGHIDPEYSRLLQNVMKKGVEAMAYKAEVSPREIVLTEPVQVTCS